MIRGFSVLALVFCASASSVRASELWVLTSGSNVRRYDATTGAFLGVPGGAFRAQGFDVDNAGRLFLASHGFAQLYRIDPAGGGVSGPAQIARPLNPRLAPDGLLYVNYVDGVVRCHSPADLSVVNTFLPVGAANSDIRFGPDGHLWANNFDAIRSYNILTGAEIDHDPATPAVDPFATVSASGDFTFAPNGDLLIIRSRGVFRYDRTTRVGTEFVAAPAVSDPSPTSLAFGPDANLYVSTTDDEILRYNGQTGALIGGFISDSDLDTPVEMLFVVPEPGGVSLLLCLGLAAVGRRRTILRARRYVG
jgi:sugar lactone lactonase YvrE